MTEPTATVTAPRSATTTGADPKWWTLVAVCLGVFILLLDITIVNVALRRHPGGPATRTSPTCSG